MKTKYGIIEIILENGVLKCDFDKSKFNSASDFLSFLNDKELHKLIFRY